MQKSGFTLAELIISLVVMVTVAAASFPIAFKKVRSEGTITAFDAKTHKVCTKEEDKDSVIVLHPDIRREFVEILLVGGGAGGSEFGGGSAGEAKAVRYPSLTGTYRIVLGDGGNVGKDGQSTAIYKYFKKENGDEGWELLEYARGGVATNDSTITQEEGEKPSYIIAGSECGNGGKKGKKGKRGEVKISW